MHTNLRATLSTIALGLGIAAALPLDAAADSGHLMALTVQVQQTMAGAPAIPPHTLVRQMCMRPGAFDAKAFVHEQSQSGCQLRNYTRQGNTVTFDEVCEGAEPSTSHGTFQLTDGADFTGDMHTAFSAAGRAITVDTHYAGKQLGACKYSPPASG